MIPGSFRFARFAPALAALYLAILFVALLYPFDFSWPYAARDNSVIWPDNGKGIAFGKSGMLVTAGPPTDLFQRLASGDGLSVELWLETASAHQAGPARIVSYSLNPWERNFTLGQQGRDLIVRLRTTATNADGIPSLDVPDVFRPGSLQHIVVTYGGAGERVYVDGRLKAASVKPGGGFATWDPFYFLAFGNEVSGGRPWDGTIAYAAIFDRALPENQVAARYQAGRGSGGRPAAAGLLVAYDFAEGPRGLASAAHEPGSVSPTPPLEKPARVASHARLFFLYIDGKMIFAATSAWDLIRNVILFMPFGALGFALLSARGRSAASAAAIAVAAACFVSAACEALQFLEETRTSSIFDLGTNVMGAVIGAAGYWYLSAWPGLRRWVRKPTA